MIASLSVSDAGSFFLQQGTCSWSKSLQAFVILIVKTHSPLIRADVQGVVYFLIFAIFQGRNSEEHP